MFCLKRKHHNKVSDCHLNSKLHCPPVTDSCATSQQNSNNKNMTRFLAGKASRLLFGSIGRFAYCASRSAESSWDSVPGGLGHVGGNLVNRVCRCSGGGGGRGVGGDFSVCAAGEGTCKWHVWKAESVKIKKKKKLTKRHKHGAGGVILISEGFFMHVAAPSNQNAPLEPPFAAKTLVSRFQSIAWRH